MSGGYPTTSRGLAVLQAIADIRLERAPDGTVRSADPRVAVEQLRALFEREMSRRDALEPLLVKPPLGLIPRWFWLEQHPEPDALERAERRAELLDAVQRRRAEGIAAAPEWIGELVMLEVQRRRDVAAGPEACTYWTTAEARAVEGELDEILAALDGWRVAEETR